VIDVRWLGALGVAILLGCGAAAELGRQTTSGALHEAEDAGPALASHLGHDAIVGAVQGLADSDPDAGSRLARAMGQSLAAGAVAGAASSLPRVLAELPPTTSAAASAAVAGASPGVERLVVRVLSSTRATERGAVGDLVDAGATLEDHAIQDGIALLAAADAMLTRQRLAATQDALDVLAEAQKTIGATQNSAQRVEWTAGSVLVWAALGISLCVTTVSLALHWKGGGSMAKEKGS